MSRVLVLVLVPYAKLHSISQASYTTSLTSSALNYQYVCTDRQPSYRENCEWCADGEADMRYLSHDETLGAAVLTRLIRMDADIIPTMKGNIFWYVPLQSYNMHFLFRSCSLLCLVSFNTNMD